MLPLTSKPNGTYSHGSLNPSAAKRKRTKMSPFQTQITQD